MSQMASQLLMYAGHPAFSSYAKIALDASSAATTPGVITPPPTRTWHTVGSLRFLAVCTGYATSTLYHSAAQGYQMMW